MDRAFKTLRGILFALCIFPFSNAFAQFDDGSKAGFKMGALGDSITIATNSDGFGHRPKFSWATGTGSTTRNFTSHFLKLKKLKRNDVAAYNKAKGGARAKNIVRQAKELVSKKLDYATILIGANDLCAWKEHDQGKLDEYEGNVRKAIQTLLKSNEKMKILLLPVPDMYNLWKVNSDNKKCTRLWNSFGVCKPILSSSLTPGKREEFKQRWEDVNRTLGRISTDYPDNIKFNDEIANTKFDKSHISTIDCFHPSVKGQQLISKLAWESGWFE
jgi:lysophospholipase L1-like esterase